MEEAYKVPINVPTWQANTDDWDFDLEDIAKWAEPGTKIEITNLNEQVKEEFELDTFVSALIELLQEIIPSFSRKDSGLK